MLLAQDYLALEGEAGEGALLEHHDVVSLQTEVVVRTKINNKVIKNYRRLKMLEIILSECKETVLSLRHRESKCQKI